MSREIIPLRPKGAEQSALARIDVAAVALLAGGQATSLQAARAKVILADLRLRRNEMTTLLSDLRSRETSRLPHIDVANANLIAAIVQGLVQIDLFIAQACGLIERTEQPGTPPLGESGQALKGA
ncbi:hypothetical protein MKK68_01885 [Methylobacterium sp. E-016]|uniref:hypothetical protein n=1 Tax=Methylobacterium sp. E-016 TaxID=2836556 RepID=UPI001FB9724B|nr:hypothetical protein [Methylobacterium sp. E-016]MCJ2074412.1 hypothetical protein [Methylobacterium sp. E-016]